MLHTWNCQQILGEQPDIEGKARFLYRKLFIGGIGEHPEMGLMKLR